MIGLGNNTSRKLRESVDWRLVITYILLVLVGIVNIYASIHSSEPSSIFDPSCRSGKQALWFGASLLVAVLILFVVNPRIWEVISTPSYLFVFILLVLVIFLGKEVNGSRSWFDLKFVMFQPAEVSKVTTSLLLARVMSNPSFKMSDRRNFFTAAAVVALPMLAILGESETGSALVYVGFLFALYREGLSGWYLSLLALCIATFIITLTTEWWISLSFIACICIIWIIHVFKHTHKENQNIRRIAIRNSILGLLVGTALVFATDFIFNNVLQDHQRKRIEVLLGMKEDPSGVGYNVRQSMIAIGSGGFSGKGFLQGTQTTYGFVPEQSTDFIFCTIGEEWGFIGCFVVIILYSLLIVWILQDADKSREAFTRIYGYCLASCIFMHLMINIGMTIGLIPVIGIPLPLISYGGSSLLAFTILIFIFIALDHQEKKYF